MSNWGTDPPHSWISVVFNSLQPCRQWNSPAKNPGVGSHSLLQGIFPIWGSNPGLLSLLHCRQILYCLSHQGSPTCSQLSLCMVHLYSRFHIHRSNQPQVLLNYNIYFWKNLTHVQDHAMFKDPLVQGSTVFHGAPWACYRGILVCLRTQFGNWIRKQTCYSVFGTKFLGKRIQNPIVTLHITSECEC